LKPTAASSGVGDPAVGSRTSPCNLKGRPAEEVARRWLEDAISGHDLLIVEAPPLSASVDAALLGRACSGLVLVAEALATARQDLGQAAETARLADCPLLGLVLTGSRDWLPGWLSRIMDGLGLSRKPAQRLDRDQGDF
jgi:hypothetical protein